MYYLHICIGITHIIVQFTMLSPHCRAPGSDLREGIFTINFYVGWRLLLYRN